MESKFHICRHCGNLVGLIHDAGVPLMCCGTEMEALIPNTAETGSEKHLPLISQEENQIHVQVGAVSHPMSQDHSIQWVYLLTNQGGQRKNLCPGKAPEVTFSLCGDTPIAAYAFCNQHGLWMASIES